MKIYFAIPSYRGIKLPAFAESLKATYAMCKERGHEAMEPAILQGSCYVQVARNELVKQFRATDADVLFFLDDDLEWDAVDALRLIEMEDDLVAGVYPKKTNKEDYPVVLNVDAEGYPATVRDDGAISAFLLPTGFMRIKRNVIERMADAYESLLGYSKYDFKTERHIDGYVDLFPQGVQERRWWGEDFAFCRLWNGLEGKVWAVPDMNLGHWDGETPFYGNYHHFLMRQPGGIEYNRYNLAKAHEIPGWMSTGELEWLAKQASKHAEIVELGSFLGRSTRALADNAAGVVYAMDDWNGPREAEWPTDIRENLYPGFCGHLADHIATSKVIPCKVNHSAAAADFSGSPDMVFIDGDHGYESVTRDISVWKQRLQPGGLLCGHDAHWQGVKQAVRELVPSAQIAPGTSIWYAEIA